jgi:hypothetical protein
MVESTSYPDRLPNKKIKQNSKSSKAKEKSSGLYNFLKLLEEMDTQSITQKSKSGRINGPFGSKADYNYDINTETQLSDFHTLQVHPKLLTHNPVKHRLKKAK